MSQVQTPFWSLNQKELFQTLQTDENGLSDEEAKKRLVIYGLNEIEKGAKRTGFSIFLTQFKNPLILVLLGAALISFFLSETVDAIVIIAIVLISAVLGFFQEYKAEKALQVLEKFLTRKARVLRQKEVEDINAQDLVPGDIVLLHLGDIIPADIRLLEEQGLSLNEASLTGESLPVQKQITVVNKELSLPTELKNMVFMGSSVLSGLGRGVVVGTAKNTFIGKTAKYLQEKEFAGEFQKSINSFSGFLLKVILAMTIFVFISNAILGKGFFDSFLFAVALAVGITPEVLPILMTIALSNGALKMAKEKVIVKKLASVEDFGNVDTLCCDKTGTLTEGVLSLIKYINVEDQEDEKVLIQALLCNTERKIGKHFIFNNPLDKALWEDKRAAKFQPVVSQYQILAENEFDFERRRSSVMVKGAGKELLVVKGASDAMLAICSQVKSLDKVRSFTPQEKLKIEKRINDYEKQGYRVIVVGQKEIGRNKTNTKESDLTLEGFLLFQDPAKKTAANALRTLQKLEVKIKILSGDSPFVTEKICQDVGLEIEKDKIITGNDLQGLNELEIEALVRQYNVFSRVTPEQKYLIVKSLNKEGHIVGFLGDGVNDAPALKIADVGISVNSGTEIAKEAADVILLHKNLQILADGIVEGRKIFSNITKYILNTISANFGNMFTVAASSLFLKFIPLLPSQILLNNFISDLPLLTISTDHVDEELLKKPRRWNIKLISRFMIYFGFISTFFDLALIIPLIWFFKVDEAVFRTAWFIESSLSEIVVTFAIRTRHAFWKSQVSKLLLWVSIGTICGTIILPFLPIGQELFEFKALPLFIVGFIALILGLYFGTTEVLKRYFFRRFEL